jgi:hypothetical protein
MQRIVRNIILNVRQEIFIRRDSESRRSVLPLNFEGAARVEIGKGADWSFLSFDLTIASNSGQMASGNQNDTPSKQNYQDFSHVNVFFVVMRRRPVLDSSKFKEGRLSTARQHRLEVCG